MHSVRRADQRSATPEGPPGGQSARAKYVWTELAIAVVAQDVGRARCHAFKTRHGRDFWGAGSRQARAPNRLPRRGRNGGRSRDRGGRRQAAGRGGGNQAYHPAFLACRNPSVSQMRPIGGPLEPHRTGAGCPPTEVPPKIGSRSLKVSRERGSVSQPPAPQDFTRQRGIDGPTAGISL
jgi:hypothetical protein